FRINRIKGLALKACLIFLFAGLLCTFVPTSALCPLSTFSVTSLGCRSRDDRTVRSGVCATGRHALQDGCTNTHTHTLHTPTHTHTHRYRTHTHTDREHTDTHTVTEHTHTHRQSTHTHTHRHTHTHTHTQTPLSLSLSLSTCFRL